MRWTSVVSVWAAAAVAAVLIGVFAAPHVYLGWLGIAMAAAVLVSMCLQLATQEKRGFVIRMGASLAGSFVILALATLVLAVVHA
jgi:formate-dependent nitrite reductase membrane component NrfD